MKAKDQRIADLKKIITELDPQQALESSKSGAIILDIREREEIAQGSPTGAQRMGRGFLEMNIEDLIPDKASKIHVMCASGLRALFVAESLNLLGYSHVASITGGFNRWKNEGLPFEIPPTLNDDAKERYSRHILMPNVGEKGQLKLLNSRVLCIGAGGIGSPVSMYLAAAGVGYLGIVDHDVVDRSNLQRQILHAENTIGQPKVESAKQRLTGLNPSINVIAHKTHINMENVDDILKDYDIVVDGSDNIPTRYLVNDACVKLGLPNVHGAVFRFEGQVTVFWPSHPEQPAPCYRCLFPNPSTQNVVSCSQAGVLGVLPGVIGLLQAVETVKIILELGKPLLGRMLYYDALAASFHQLKLKRNPNCRFCGDNVEFPGYEDVAQICASKE